MTKLPESLSRDHFLIFVVVALVIVTTSACGGSLYKVKPVVRAPMADGAAGTDAGGLRVRAVPLLSDEESFELFGSNLLLAGLLPVRIELNNGSSASIELKKSGLVLRDDQGRVWKLRSSKEVVARVLKANAVTAYNPSARKKFEEDLRAHAIDLDLPLTQGEQRSGLVFFQSPRNEVVSSPHQLALGMEKLPQPVVLKLN